MALFGTKTSKSVALEVVDEKIASTVKYDKPKILLIDVESSAFDTLSEAGFNVKAGTFGQPYKVQMSSGSQPLISEPRLPNYTEQEIVIVDLHYEVAEYPVGEKSRPDGDHNFLIPSSRY